MVRSKRGGESKTIHDEVEDQRNLNGHNRKVCYVPETQTEGNEPYYKNSK